MADDRIRKLEIMIRLIDIDIILAIGVDFMCGWILRSRTVSHGLVRLYIRSRTVSHGLSRSCTIATNRDLILVTLGTFECIRESHV